MHGTVKKELENQEWPLDSVILVKLKFTFDTEFTFNLTRKGNFKALRISLMSKKKYCILLKCHRNQDSLDSVQLDLHFI